MCGGRSNRAADQALAQSKLEAEKTREEIRRTEEERQGRIRQGQSIIDKAFSQYGQPYFDKFRNEYVAAPLHDIEEQHSQARDKLTAALAGRGVLGSTISANAMADLEGKRIGARGRVSDEASDAATAFRGRIESAKGSLYDLNTSAADPNMIASRAQGELTTLVPPKQTSSMAGLFNDVLAPFVNYVRADAYSPRGGTFSSFFTPPTSGRGSGRIFG